MRLVIVWSVGDGYTYCCENTQPVNYESAEKFLVDFGEWKKTNPKPVLYTGEGFAGTDLGPDVDESTLEVLTVDEWFEWFAP